MNNTPRTDMAWGIIEGQTLANEETPYECSVALEKEVLAKREQAERTMRQPVSEPVGVNGQTHGQTAIEVLVGTGIGFAIALMSQVFMMYWYGLPSTFGQDVGITMFFTGISILRGYAVRRYFNWRHNGNTSNRGP